MNIATYWRYIDRTAVEFTPDLSRDTVCKTCGGIFYEECDQEALRRKGELQEQLEIPKYALQELGIHTLLHLETFEESLGR